MIIKMIFEKNLNRLIRVPGVPQEPESGRMKTTARKKGIRADAESLLGVLIKQTYYYDISVFKYLEFI
jgi:hypothetical protein